MAGGGELGRDFGANRRDLGTVRAQRLVIGVALALAAGVAAAILIPQARHQNAEAEARDAAWDVEGPPCPQISAAAYRQLAIDHLQPFAFEGLHGMRAHGDVSCNDTDRDGARRVAEHPVCQLRAPFALVLATPRGDVYYEPGVAQPVTVSAPGGEPRCVMAANPANW
jgi:hypothetical protein